MSNYDDIIELPHHVSKKHPQMSLYNRAAQFSPFAALTGYGDIIDETGRETSSRIELDEYEKESINNLLEYLNENKNVEATYTYFVKDSLKRGGEYLQVTSSIKRVDEINHELIMNDGSLISIEDILQIEIDKGE